VLFTDIRGFTPLSEAQSPEETIELLNDWYALMFDAVGGHGGIVSQIQGDGLMAIFGAPQPRPDHARAAVETALEMVELVAMFSAGRAPRRPALRIGVGIATGEMVAGFIGTMERAIYTCIGDTVNLASRLEQHTKDGGRTVLIDARRATRSAPASRSSRSAPRRSAARRARSTCTPSIRASRSGTVGGTRPARACTIMPSGRWPPRVAPAEQRRERRSMSRIGSQSAKRAGQRPVPKSIVALAASVVVLGAGAALAQAPYTINVVDVAGNLALTQDALELYAKSNPGKVAKFVFTKAPAPELPGKLKAMQAAGRADIDLVLTGVGFLGNAVEQGLLTRLLPDHAAKFPNLMANYQPAAAKMQELAQGQGIEVVFMPAGPLIEYNPAKVKQPPTTAQELLAWCKANPEPADLRAAGQLRARQHVPAGLAVHPRRQGSEGPGQRMGEDLGVPQGAQQLHRVLPDRHRRVMKELGEGSRDMTVTMTGWDINPRVLGIVPKDYKVAPLKGMTWINDAHYMVVPKGVPPTSSR
jgi:putative spermidine/putrescine transport system substrate-binding protein